jgi:hypothetical protein
MFGGVFSRIAMRDVLFTYKKLGMFNSENKSYSKRLSILMIPNLTSKVYICCRFVQCRLRAVLEPRLHNPNSPEDCKVVLCQVERASTLVKAHIFGGYTTVLIVKFV